MGQTIPTMNCGRQDEVTAFPSPGSIFVGAESSIDPTLDTPMKGKTEGKTENDAVSLCFAATSGKIEEVKALLRAKANVNAVDYDKRSALHIAAADGQEDITKLLLENQADPLAMDRWGQSPLDEADRGGHNSIRDILVEHGAQRKGSNDAARRTVSRTASESGSSGNGMDDSLRLCCAAANSSLSTLQGLKEAGANLNAGDYDGRTALHVAASYGHKAIVAWLLEEQADPQKCDNFGLTPLSEARRMGHVGVAQLLAVKGSEASRTAELRLQSTVGCWEIPASQIELGDVLSTTEKSIIYIAMWRGTKVVAKTLLRKKPIKHNVNRQGLAGMQPSQSEEDELYKLGLNEVLHEISLLATMRHPDLVLFLGACIEHETPLVLTEYMEGGDLERYMRNQALRNQGGNVFRPPWMHFLKWSSAVARALAFLHNCTRPIIHRDLKPLNLLLTANQDIKVSDFGISKLMTPYSKVDHEAAPFMSGGVGTYRYMAPEVVRYQQYTDRVDIYSFALIMWFMSTGLQPFADQFGRDPERILKDYLKGHEPRPAMQNFSAANSKYTAILRQLIEDCWHVTPSKRPSAEECAQRLTKMMASPEGPLSVLKSKNPFSRMMS